MKRSLSLLLTLAVAASTASAQNKGKKVSSDAGAERELLKLNQEYDAALVRGDAAVLDRIYADEFTYTSTGGEVLDKARQIELIRSGALKIESGASEGVEVRLYRGTALVLGYFKAKGQFKGQSFDSTERYISVWVRRGGRWQLVAEQGTSVPKR